MSICCPKWAGWAENPLFLFGPFQAFFDMKGWRSLDEILIICREWDTNPMKRKKKDTFVATF